MKKLLILLFGLSCILNNAAAMTVIPAYSMQDYDHDITRIYKTLTATSISTRIDEISKQFLAKPYLNDPLGEGAHGQFDQGPLYRTDAFDCLTYVATVLALAKAQNLAQFQKMIKQINYEHPPIQFATRNHIMSTDWNPVNIKQGFIQDITATIVDPANKPIAMTATATIDKRAWFQKLPASRLRLLRPLNAVEEQPLLNALHDLSRQFHAQQVSMHYLPLSRLFTQDGTPRSELFAQIPSGAIIEIVRPNWDLTAAIGTHLLVSHVGFAIKTPQGLIYREASSVEHKVIDIPLSTYLKGYLSSSTIKGIAVMRVL